MIAQGFNYTASTVKEMNDFFEIRKKIQRILGKRKRRKPSIKRKEDQIKCHKVTTTSFANHRLSKEYYILNRKFSHTKGNCKDLQAMIDKHKQKKKQNFKLYMQVSYADDLLMQDLVCIEHSHGRLSLWAYWGRLWLLVVNQYFYIVSRDRN